LTSLPVPLIFQWYTQSLHLDQALWQLLQETLALGGTLALLLPLIRYSFYLIKWTVSSFTPDHSNSCSYVQLTPYIHFL
jgi:hypothetical protein